MGDSGYRGVSADQDGRYRNKEQALLKQLASKGQFPPQFDQKVLMTKVNLEVIKPWISDKVGELLGFEDDVVVEYVNGMLEDPDNKQPDPKKMQLSLTGFLESNTPKFMAELWTLLISAQNSLGGIPQEFVEKKKQEMREARERDAKAIKGSGAVHDYRAEGSSRQNDGLEARGGGRGRGRGRGRGSRFDDRGPRRDFTDKSGNRTERVHDRGWGARSGVRDEEPRRSDAYPPRRSYEDNNHGERSRGRYYDDRRIYEDRYERRPEPRYSSRSPSPDRRDRKSRRSVTPEIKRGNDRPRSRSSSPRPAPQRRDRSVTPELPARRRRNRSRSYSRSRSPPPNRRRRPISHSKSPSSPPRRLVRKRSVSRSSSRSPISRTGRNLKRSSTESYSPQPHRKGRDRSYSRSLSPSGRSPSPPPRGKKARRPRSISRSVTPKIKR